MITKPSWYGYIFEHLVLDEKIRIEKHLKNLLLLQSCDVDADEKEEPGMMWDVVVSFEEGGSWFSGAMKVELMKRNEGIAAIPTITNFSSQQLTNQIINDEHVHTWALPKEPDYFVKHHIPHGKKPFYPTFNEPDHGTILIPMYFDDYNLHSKIKLNYGFRRADFSIYIPTEDNYRLVFLYDEDSWRKRYTQFPATQKRVEVIDYWLKLEKKHNNMLLSNRENPMKMRDTKQRNEEFFARKFDSSEK